MIGDGRVRWPVGLTPSTAPVFSHNAREIAAPIETTWAWLVAAARWSEFYSNCKRLRIAGSGATLQAGDTFTWWTFGVPVTTTIEGFEPCRYLAWTGRGLGARGHHVWLLEETAPGCRVITEETQVGAIPWALSSLLRRGLLHQHQRWLDGLARVAETGPPRDPTESHGHWSRR